MTSPSHNDGIVLDGRSLTPEIVARVARGAHALELSPDALRDVVAGRELMVKGLEEGWPIYGVTRGTGQLHYRKVSPEEARKFARQSTKNRFIYGAVFPPDVGRAVAVVVANTLLRGRTGVRPELVAQLVAMLNSGLSPALTEEVGLLGIGDLGAMEQLGASVTGEGRVWHRGEIRAAAEAQADLGITPLYLEPPEGSVLAGSNGVTLGLGSLVLVELEELAILLDAAAALALEGYAANLSIVREEISANCPLPGHLKVTERLRRLLGGSKLLNRGHERHIHDALSFRCIPQVHGALTDALRFVRDGLDVLLNSSLVNPMVVVESNEIVPNANFDMTRLSIAFDMVRIVLARTARMEVERIQKQMFPSFSDLPTGLEPEEGLGRGLNELGRFAAQLAGEVNRRAHPTSGDMTVSLADGMNDQMPGTPLGILATREAVDKTLRLVTLELIVAAQALELRGLESIGEGARIAFTYVRERVPFLEERTEFQADLELVRAGLTGELLRRLRPVVEAST